jgi:hypothetical protein
VVGTHVHDADVIPMMNNMLGFGSAAIAGTAVKASATANATAHKKYVFVDDALIFVFFHFLPWVLDVQASNSDEWETA